MGRLKNLLYTAAALTLCANDVYHTRDFNRDQYRSEIDTNNYKANEKVDTKILRPYKVKGYVIMAYSKKDAIKRFKHYKL